MEDTVITSEELQQQLMDTVITILDKRALISELAQTIFTGFGFKRLLQMATGTLFPAEQRG
jgi:uncharacterized protein YebE (UPF0316 family)